MKFLFPLLFIFSAITCKSNQQTLTDSITKSSNAMNCPDDGKCTLEILKQKSINIKTDEFGSIYPEITDGTSILLKFEYERDTIPNTADGGYTEIIYVELDANHLETELQNKELGNAKLLFARLCFCRGQTGYYRITNGHLSIKKSSSDTYSMTFDFKTDEVPQVITTINEEFSLN